MSLSFFLSFFFVFLSFLGKKMGKKKWENNGESGVFLSLRLIMGRRRIKKSLPSCIRVSPALAFSTQNTPLDDTTCGYQKEEEKRTLGNEKENIVFFDRAFCWGASTTREPLSLSLSIYIYIDDDEQKMRCCERCKRHARSRERTLCF